MGKHPAGPIWGGKPRKLKMHGTPLRCAGRKIEPINGGGKSIEKI